MDDIVYVGRMFLPIKNELADKGIPYTAVRTQPPNAKFQLDETCLYVIREQTYQGVLTLTVAAKMGKEVS